MSVIGRGIRFLRFNRHRRMSIKAFLYSAEFRFKILFIDPKKIYKEWGIEGEESPEDADISAYRLCRNVALVVEHVCNRTRWESKCLVRALTAQRLLAEKGVESTMYLGCKLDEHGKMVAHAWVRCGKVYVTGGNGEGYAIVDRFRSRIA
ncbi:lasso peptide biosynthesis B2 protein [Butyrivibrio sp. MC2013]|uniref:lasso peptide biosynthesis B2 protein n=1 Tax=Butyrivibrio sp. MC2013 TaxID=1280686 RepID=UPI0003FEBBEB|nr:lasso peptide biosynthesis B2 protein [Butyrivibrio sp. MC2013]